MAWYDDARQAELLTIRPDMVDEFPDGVPRWLRDQPPGRVREFMRLRLEGWTLIGNDPAEAPL